MFSKEDKDQITGKGISQDTIEYQLEKFRTGFPFTRIINTATIDKGLLSHSDSEKELLIESFDKLSNGLAIKRFVPASGAATRMFKSLFAILQKLKDTAPGDQQDVINADPEVKAFFENIESYPFYADLNLSGTENYFQILDKLLNDNGLSYGKLPKGLLKFHNYSKGSRTAFEEHLREAAGYCAQEGTVNMHFTISPEHYQSFTDLEDQVLPGLEKELSLIFNLSYSFQKEETDTLAVDNENKPFRDAKGKLVFRPGGHGALLENLSDIGGDIVFITNIDNVAPDRFKDSRIRYKKFLGGVLLKAREEIYRHLEVLSMPELPDPIYFLKLFSWMSDVMYISVPVDVIEGERSNQRDWALNILDRPIRVCGMVKNEGEPGGGPFFVEESNGNVSLQVVEPSQIDVNDPAQKSILASSTHFNPVDLVCSLRNQVGEKYNLMDYRDPDAGFITAKSMLGKDLKAQELPGLWNGSMAHWTTMFVEVPGLTFTPVKTVFDLTRSEHLGEG